MKTTICPTDSSQPAANAINYSKVFCKTIQSELILMHKSSISNLFTSSPQAKAFNNIRGNSYTYSPADIYKQKMAAVEYQYQSDPVTQIQHIYTIALAAQAEQADLIIAGVEKEFGFNDLYHQSINNLVRQAKCPVLLVPEGVRFSTFKKIVLVIDHDFDIAVRIPFIAHLAEYSRAEVYFLQINKERNTITHYPFFASAIDMYLTFPYEFTSFHEVVNECVPEAIRLFVENVHVDLVITIPNQDEPSTYSQATSLNYNEFSAKPLPIPLLAIDALTKQPINSVGYPYN